MFHGTKVEAKVLSMVFSLSGTKVQRNEKAWNPFPHDRDTGLNYCRMLLNDTLLNVDSFRNGFRESPVCDCNKERETVSHFLLRCLHYEEIRNKLQNVVDDIWTSAKRKDHMHLSDNLLAPTQNDYVTKRMDRDIKLAFF